MGQQLKAALSPLGGRAAWQWKDKKKYFTENFPDGKIFLVTLLLISR